MPYSYTIEENVREGGLCQQEPSKTAGDMWIDDDHRLCVVDNVRFVKYVWEDVALWEIRITAYREEEISPELHDRYNLFLQKKAIEQQSLKKEADEKERKWRKDCKLRKIDIGKNGKYVVEVYEYSGQTRLRACEGERNDATKLIVPKYIDAVNDFAFIQDKENIEELVFLNDKCAHGYGFGGFTNLKVR